VRSPPRIDVRDDEVIAYRRGPIEIDHADFGADGKDDANFGEDAYFPAQSDAQDSLSGCVFIRGALGLTIAQIADAFAKVELAGEQLWPSPEVFARRDEMEFMAATAPMVPAPPLWEWMTER